MHSLLLSKHCTRAADPVEPRTTFTEGNSKLGAHGPHVVQEQLRGAWSTTTPNNANYVCLLRYE